MVRDPQTKTLLVQVDAVPDMLPRKECCVRVTRVNNSWRYTPLENGNIQVEFQGDFDFGIPYPLFNSMISENVYGLLSGVESIFNSEEYEHADFPFLKEQ